MVLTKPHAEVHTLSWKERRERGRREAWKWHSEIGAIHSPFPACLPLVLSLAEDRRRGKRSPKSQAASTLFSEIYFWRCQKGPGPAGIQRRAFWVRVTGFEMQRLNQSPWTTTYNLELSIHFDESLPAHNSQLAISGTRNAAVSFYRQA